MLSKVLSATAGSNDDSGPLDSLGSILTSLSGAMDQQLPPKVDNSAAMNEMFKDGEKELENQISQDEKSDEVGKLIKELVAKRINVYIYNGMCNRDYRNHPVPHDTPAHRDLL